MRRASGFGLLILIGAMAPIGAVSRASAQAGKIVFLVRHAEKSAEPAGDPALTDEGCLRAEALAAALEDAGIDHVITTQLRRTVDTAALVVKNGNLDPEIVAVRGGIDDHIRSVADAVRSRPDGEAILVVGHSNTIPAIVGELGGSKFPDLKDDEYATIFIVVLSDAKGPRTIRLTFGAPEESAR